MVARILKLLKESSTYAGLAGVLAGLGLFGFAEAQWQQIFAAVAAVSGVIAMIILEKGDKDPQEDNKEPPAS